MATDVTTIAVSKAAKTRFRKRLVIDRKKRKERHFYNEDFLMHLLDLHEQTDGKYEH